MFLKLLHLSNFTEFRPSSETVSQALLAPVSEFAHSVAPSAHREGHGERETSQILLRVYHHQSRKRDLSLSSSVCISHILLRAAPSKQRERGRERHTHRLPSSSLSLKFFSDCSTIKAAADTEFVVLLQALLPALMVLTPNRLAHSSPTSTQNSSGFETDVLRAIAATDWHQNRYRFEPRDHRMLHRPPECINPKRKELVTRGDCCNAPAHHHRFRERTLAPPPPFAVMLLTDSFSKNTSLLLLVWPRKTRIVPENASVALLDVWPVSSWRILACSSLYTLSLADFFSKNSLLLSC